MPTYTFEIGDLESPADEDSAWGAGIHVTDEKGEVHWQRIICWADGHVSEIEKARSAVQLRDHLLDALASFDPDTMSSPKPAHPYLKGGWQQAIFVVFKEANMPIPTADANQYDARDMLEQYVNARIEAAKQPEAPTGLPDIAKHALLRILPRVRANAKFDSILDDCDLLYKFAEDVDTKHDWFLQDFTDDNKYYRCTRCDTTAVTSIRQGREDLHGFGKCEPRPPFIHQPKGK